MVKEEEEENRTFCVFFFLNIGVLLSFLYSSWESVRGFCFARETALVSRLATGSKVSYFLFSYPSYLLRRVLSLGLEYCSI